MSEPVEEQKELTTEVVRKTTLGRKTPTLARSPAPIEGLQKRVLDAEGVLKKAKLEAIRLKRGRQTAKLSVKRAKKEAKEARRLLEQARNKTQTEGNGAKTHVNKDSNGQKSPLKGKKYEKELAKLQAQLCYLQDWVKHKGLRVIVIFEGRDAAGKGGTIRAITERVSPRVFRVVALPAPSDREKTMIYLQRYMAHFPAGGEIVIFDRSWYNRAGVEHVMGFCTDEQYEGFLKVCPEIEKYIVDAGIILIKFWLEVSDKEQKRRFEARISDPLRQWKLSPMDLPSRSKWFDYSRARDRMLEATDTKHAPWNIVLSDDKKRARLNCIAHLLKLIPYKRLPREEVKLPKRSMKGSYDDMASIRDRNFIPQVY